MKSKLKMAGYIDKNDLKEYISGYIKSCNGKPTYTDIDAMVGIISLLEQMPAADVQPVKHGRWIYKGTVNSWDEMACSCCNAAFATQDREQILDWEFCPHCGADMRGETK